jgi:hypothetical protein
MDNSQNIPTESDSTNLLNINRNIRCYNIKNLPKRYILAVFSFFGYFFAYSLRANLSVGIVQMSRLNENNINSTSSEHQIWSTSLQGYILSSFFYGYIVTQVIFYF